MVSVVSRLYRSQFLGVVTDTSDVVPQVLGWRDVPVDNSNIGATAKRAEPLMRQVFVAPQDPDVPEDQLKLQVRTRDSCASAVILGFRALRLHGHFAPNFDYITRECRYA